jgi:hypothetical protein
MEDLSKYSPTELLKTINEITVEHEKIKREIVEHTNEIDIIEKVINTKLIQMDSLERDYITLIEEFNNR